MSGFLDKTQWVSSVEALESHRNKRPQLLARTLLFFLPHPLPQLLTDISQGVLRGGERLYCVAKPVGLRFPAMEAKQ